MKNNKNAFTLVELLAVIVILAIILVIAVPKVMSIIGDAKKGNLESTAKMVASAAEKAKVQNTVLGNTDEITCESVTKLNNVDYESCSITFEGNTAKVTLIGKGKFSGLNVCGGTKTGAEAIDEECPIPGSEYIANLLKNESTLNNGLQQTTATYTNEDGKEVIVDAGIRYVGATNAVKNQVYFNCEPTDGTNAYGSENYNYASSCEIWRIIGVFDVEDGEGNTQKRIKIININSIFRASWDSSDSSINGGYGVNQWGPSTYTDGSIYDGADLMQLLNGYYIGKLGSECKYNNTSGESGLAQNCTKESLTSAKMKPLTNKALGMIENVLWYTFATNTSTSVAAYLQEKGITQKYTGCLGNETVVCIKDDVTRDNEWIGLVGLMSVSDITYSIGWLYNGTDIPWSISPFSKYGVSRFMWYSNSSGAGSSQDATNSNGVWPSVYLSANVKIIEGNGDTEPYKLSL